MQFVVSPSCWSHLQRWLRSSACCARLKHVVIIPVAFPVVNDMTLIANSRRANQPANRPTDQPANSAEQPAVPAKQAADQPSRRPTRPVSSFITLLIMLPSFARFQWITLLVVLLSFARIQWVNAFAHPFEMLGLQSSVCQLACWLGCQLAFWLACPLYRFAWCPTNEVLAATVDFSCAPVARRSPGSAPVEVRENQGCVDAVGGRARGRAGCKRTSV